MATPTKQPKLHYSFQAKDGDKERTFGIKRMGHKEKDMCDLFYSSTTSKYIKAGVLPRAAYKVTLDNLGGTISEKDLAENELNKNLLVQKSIDLSECNLKKEEDRNADDLIKITVLTNEVKALQDKILLFESTQFMIYENTAEAKARNKTITWLLLHLSYEKIGDNYVPLFKGRDLDEKLDEYEELQENEFIVKVLGRINYLITLWFLGRIETDEEFKKFDEDAQKVEKDEVETPREVSAADLSPAESTPSLSNTNSLDK